MGTIPRFSRPGQFDRYCKLVLEHEAIDYLRKMDSLRDRHISLSILPQREMDKLSTVDRYPSDSHVFTSHGCDLPIENELVADAFAALTEQEQSILILHCVLGMSDGKIGEISISLLPCDTGVCGASRACGVANAGQPPRCRSYL